MPVQPLAGVDHGVREEGHLLAVEFVAVAGDDKGGELDLGIPVVGNVAHDGAEIRAPQALARDLAEQRSHGFGRLGLGHGHLVARLHAELGEGVLRQAQLVAAHDGGIVHHVHCGQDAQPVGAHLDLGQRLEALGPVHGAVAVQVGDVLAPGVDRHTAQGQLGTGLRACGVGQGDARVDRGSGRGRGGGLSVHRTSLYRKCPHRLRDHPGSAGLGPSSPGLLKATLNKSPQWRAPWFGMGCKAQTAAIAVAIARICNAADRPKQGCATDLFSVALILLCHKRSRTFTVAQYGQCPKALASATLN